MKLSSKLVLVAAVCLSLGACSGKKTAGTADAQVAVKVNGEPISVAELDDKAGNMRGPKEPGISAPLLKMVIDTELLRQAAIQSKLDLDEKIRTRLANTDRMILATGYMEKQLAAVAKPTEADIGAYYNQHPERYADRKQFDMQEVAIQPKPGEESEIQAQLAKTKTFDAFVQWLKGKLIPYNTNPVTTTSDQISEDALQKIKDLPAGGYTVLGDKGQMHVIFVLNVQPQPIALAQVSRMVANQLVEKRKKGIVDDIIKSLRDKAKIEYVAPYTEHGLAASGQ